MDAYLEEELYDILTYCIQNPNGSDLELKRKRVVEIGKELHFDGGLDSMENIFYSIEFRIKDELKKMRNRIVHGGMGFLKIGNANFKFVRQYRQYLTLFLS